MTSEVMVRDDGASIAEQVVIAGDLSKLSADQRMTYYSKVCESLGLNPLTRPFEFITLNGKLTLYATKGCTDQLRAIRRITITGLDPRQIGELYVVVATGRDYTGREDSATGAVSIKGLTGESLANAMMKAETKAKRRLTLSLAGLGLSDESEIGSIPNAQPVDVDPETGEIRKPLTLAEKAAAKAEAVVVETYAGTSPAAVSEPHNDLESLPLFDTPEEPEGPLELSTEAMRNLMREAHILPAVAMTTARDLFPDWNGRDDLTNRQRGQIWERLNP